MREDEEKNEEITEEETKQREIPGRDLYEWTQALVGSVLAVVLVFTFLIRLIGVDGHSMVPTLQNGDRLLVLSSLLDHDYEYGDIVVLREESFLEEPIVKRVIATEGQTVDIDFEAGIVYVDGEALDEPYINEPTYMEEGTEFPLTVPEGCIFVMGDNRNHSSDSRDSRLGTVDTRCVLGKAVFLAFPGADDVTGKREFGRIGLIDGVDA
ncbi:signal peptidase I [uncultured Oscillibacter sp.]|jgi:signal peptidase I|uniref:signal peptidase I n=1 Tax=uncultured Oscillibacter sp. TaxID=876091 RepID=UPI00280C1B1C|nr:signal peptidase I [uncultured Oscillibacter sp.]